MPNINEFYQGVVEIVGKMYEAFPREITLWKKDLNNNASKENIYNYVATAKFLVSEGLIKKTGALDFGFELILMSGTLTTKGFLILESEQDHSGERGTLGQRISKLLRGESDEAINVVVNQLLTTSVSWQVPTQP